MEWYIKQHESWGLVRSGWGREQKVARAARRAAERGERFERSMGAIRDPTATCFGCVDIGWQGWELTDRSGVGGKGGGPNIFDMGCFNSIW
ncbi:hypothetical protein CLOM_g5721 [Closterium sp. NIES-68]|nr:hypothetical protein CLOM_g5721 [Closterium sp. NIES-68]GJP82230.1 hypothetical protein CLOP_g12466 [Closterium sp. NIES-67]